VAVYATVAEKNGRLVPDLQRDAFEVRDNGKPQPITVFSNEVQPISVVMMLDRSGSMRGNVGLVERAAEEFIRRLAPGDSARVGTFAERVEIAPEAFTSDKDALLAVLRSDRPVAGPTPLWNALDEAVAAVRKREGRKVVLVFSDGGDAPSNLRFDNRSIMDVMRDAQRDDVMVYAIGLQTTVLRGPSGGRGGIGSMTGASSRRHRRRLLRAHSGRRSGANVRGGRGGTAPSVRARLRAAPARRSHAQAGRPGESEGVAGPGAQRILRRTAVRRANPSALTYGRV
jgi:VWFA-related protein